MAELLAVPFKKSSDVDIVKPLKNLIQNTYSGSESTEDFSDAINELSRLRTAAIWKVFEKSSLDVLYSYYDQLVSLESKIPPQEVQIPFKWKDAFDKGSIFGGRMSLTISSLAYERMCILFNIAAMQSAIAAQQPLDTEESLKLAAKLLQQAAGIFTYLKGNIMLAVHQETTPDLNPDTLNALSQLMLAQAQEVIAYKCIRDEMKESMVAKVCAQCEELFTDALRSMQKDALKNLWERDWLSTISTKQAIFRGLTQYYQAQVCRANKSVGEEIARLQVASAELRAAPSGAGGGRVGDVAARAARQLAAAQRDNDFIYHERVPEPRALDPVPRAPVAKPLAPPPRWGAAADLWERLLPAAVHAALAASGARRAELVGAEINQLRDATQLLNSILASLNLPACIESESGGGLPESIRSKARAVREAGGLPALAQLMADLPDLLQRNRDILNEADRMLREEAEADAALRQQFGARWARTPSDQLTEAFRANSAKYAQIIDNAVRADAIVQQKFQQHKEVSADTLRARAAAVVWRAWATWARRRYLRGLWARLPARHRSPACAAWPPAEPARLLARTDALLRRLHHRWRCLLYRRAFDQTARNRMREKVTASVLFRERKATYARSVAHPFVGDYVRLRASGAWRRGLGAGAADRYVVFADVVGKVSRGGARVSRCLAVVSTGALLLLEARSLRLKRRVPAHTVYRLSLSPYADDLLVVHVRACGAAESSTEELSQCSSREPLDAPGCLFGSEGGWRRRGDVVLRTCHVLELATKLFLVVQNAVGAPPHVNIAAEFEANFGQQLVTVAFHASGGGVGGVGGAGGGRFNFGSRAFVIE
ncbi:programmed cell death 6-interacting protein-like [Zerene cesonia]|uniref:programmed cell death 6-interacting protein-like n=1 Tax=Zerene cesonia TaxID=33412 RepID=UPI0018E59643|nr:programmed cell death 6-interacting protein-like [Zerene cesonia]